MLILKRDPNCSSDEFFLHHHHGGKAVGRIFNQLAGASALSDATWFWGITFDYWRRTLAAGVLRKCGDTRGCNGGVSGGLGAQAVILKLALATATEIGAAAYRCPA